MKKPILSNAENQQRVKFRDSIRGSKKKMRYIIDNRSSLSIGLYEETVDWIYREKFDTYAFHNSFPKDIALLGAYATFKQVSLKKEIIWLKSILKHHVTAINEYVVLKQQFETSFLSGNKLATIETLDLIQKKFGLSFWLLKHKIAVRQHFYGIENQKELTKKIKSSFGARSVYSYIIHNLSILNEGTKATASFIANLQKDVLKMELSNDWKLVILNYLNPIAINTIDESVVAVRHAYAHSLIDLYESTINLGKIATIKTGEIEVKKLIVELFAELKLNISDQRLNNLWFALDGTEMPKQNADSFDNLRAYLVDRLTIDDIKHNLTSSGSIGDYLLASRIVGFGPNTEKVGEQMAFHFSNILRNEGNCELSISHIDKYAIAFSGIEIFQVLSAIAHREFGNVPIGINTLSSELQTLQQQITFSLSVCFSVHPLLLLFFNEDRRLLIIGENLRNGNFQSDSFPFISVTAATDKILILERSLFICVAKLNSREWGVQSAVHMLSVSNNIFFQKSALRIYVYSLTAADEIEQATNIVTTEYLKDNKTIHILPVRELTDKIDKEMRREMRRNISVPILFDIYSLHVDGAYESIRKLSVASFLSGCNVKRPSLLQSVNTSFEPAKLVYFLSKMCIPDIIYKTGGYDSTEDLLDERIKVLRLLSSLDEENQDEYEENIVSVTRQIVLNSRRAEVEQSKIELNVDGFIRASENKLRENYSRYKSLLQAGVSGKNEHSKLSNSSDQTAVIPMALPDNEVDSLFASMVNELSDIFIKDPNYGLDGFLSTRIRHNVLEGELRSPLEQVKLVTQKDETGSYRPNEYWLGKLNYNDREDISNLNELLTEFTRLYDNLILELNERWVRIKSTDAPDGLINLSIDNIELAALGKIIGMSDFSLEYFANLTFMYLSNKLEVQLTELRTKVDKEVKERALTLLDSLERGFQQQYSFTGILAAVNEMRVEIPRAIERIVSWLRPAYEISTEPLPFKDVLQMSIEIAQRFNPQFTAEMDLNEAGDQLIQGVIVPIYSDIFVIVFHNVLKHSKLDQPHLEIYSSIEKDSIRIIFKNKLGSQTDIERLRQKINEINLRFYDGSYIEFVRGKNGTGLCRIFAIIKDHIYRDPAMKISLVNNDTIFQVEFNLPTQFIIYHSDDSTTS